MTALFDQLNSMRRRIIAFGAAGGASLGLAMAVVVLALWMWADLGLELSSDARALARWAALLTLAGLATWSIMKAARGATHAQLARRLDEAAGTRGQILTGVDLAAQASGGGRGASTMTGVSAGLAAEAVSRAAGLAQHVAAGAAVPASSLRKPFASLAAVAVAMLLFSLLAPRLASTQWARILDPYGDHPPYSSITLSVEPGNVRVVYGTGFDIHVRADGGLIDKAEVIFATGGAGGDPLPMFNEGDGKWRATVASVTEPTQYSVRAGGAASKKYAVQVITIPRLEKVRVRVTPPAYTHRPPLEGSIPPGGIHALAGTKVQFTATSNRPLSGGVIEHESGSRIIMTGTGGAGQEAVGQFTVDKPGKVTLRVTDKAGQSSTESAGTTITVLKDERPFIRLMQPMPQSFATPSTSLPIELIAEDDFGISRVAVFRSLNDSRPLPLELTVPPDQPTRLNGSDMLPLAAFGLKPGDVIKIFARVEDNDPAGAKGAECPIAVVRIISEEDFKRMVLTREGMETLQSKYAQAQRRLEAMAEELRALKEEIDKQEKEGDVSDASRQKMEELAERMREEAAAVEREAQDDLPFDLDKALKEKLEKVAKSLKEAAEQALKMAKNKPRKNSEASQELEKLVDKLAGQRKEFKEQAMDPLEHLAKVYPLIEDQSRFVRLYQAQKDLAARLASLKAKDRVEEPKDKARMRDLEEEQRGLREELKNLLDDIENHVRELPEDPRLDDLRNTAMNFVQAVRASPAEDHMLDAELNLNEFNGRAHGKAVAAEETLAQFLSQCKGMQGEGMACLKFSPGLSQGLGDTVEQLLEAAGLGTGNGLGEGSGGGFSASRSTLRNVGMYGRANASKSGSGGGRSDSGVASRSTGGNTDMSDPGHGGGDPRHPAAGASEAAVPAKYKRRVGDYFRRVADELEK